MVAYARHATSFVENCTFDDFESSTEKQFAAVRALEVIGEAAKQVSASVRDLRPNVPWTQIAKMRDRLIHHYFGVKLDTVWQTITDDLPPLVESLTSLLEELQEADSEEDS